MFVYVVFRKGEVPEGAFETVKHAKDYVADRERESSDRGHMIVSLELVKASDRPAESGFSMGSISYG